MVGVKWNRSLVERSKRRPGAERAYILAQRIGRAQSLLAVTCIAFQAVSENLGTIGFYLCLGYSVEGCRRRVHRIDERLVDEYMMARFLD